MPQHLSGRERAAAFTRRNSPSACLLRKKWVRGRRWVTLMPLRDWRAVPAGEGTKHWLTGLVAAPACQKADPWEGPWCQPPCCGSPAGRLFPSQPHTGKFIIYCFTFFNCTSMFYKHFYVIQFGCCEYFICASMAWVESDFKAIK